MIVLVTALAMSLIAAAASWVRGGRFGHDDADGSQEWVSKACSPTSSTTEGP